MTERQVYVVALGAFQQFQNTWHGYIHRRSELMPFTQSRVVMFRDCSLDAGVFMACLKEHIAAAEKTEEE